MPFLSCRHSLLIVSGLIACSLTARADIVVSGDIHLSGGTGTLQIAEDINLSISAGGNITVLAFDEWVAADASAQNVAPSSPTSLSYQINGGSVLTTPISVLRDNLGTFGAVTANDGWLYFNPISVAMGDILTIKAQTITFDGNPNFNPDALGVFSGNVFPADDSGTQLAPLTSVAVPEPQTYAVCAGLGLLAFAAWRKSRATAGC